MAGMIKSIHNWKIRRIAYVMLVGLILVLGGTYTIVQFFGLSNNEMLLAEKVFAMPQQIQQLAPAYISEDADFQELKDKVFQIENSYLLVSKGGEIVVEDEVRTIKAPKGQQQEAAKQFKEVWQPYKSTILLLSDGEISASEAREKLTKNYPALEKRAISLKDSVYTYLDEQRAGQMYFMLAVLAFSLFVFIAIYYCMRYLILGPIYAISLTSRKLAKGNLSEKIDLNSRNEIGYIAKNINSLADILKNATDFTRQIGEGNLSAEYKGLNEMDNDSNSLSQSLLTMRDQMRKSAIADKERSWVNEGLAKFADILRNNNDNINELAYNIISNLVKYVEANQGGLFVINQEEGSDERVIELKATYAYERRKRINKQIHVGEGLVGQSVQEGDKIYLTEVPDDYIDIRSGLGETSPRCVLIVPLKINEDIQGVIEIASLKDIPPYKIEFIEKLGENIASTISNTKTNEQTKHLLEESQSMTEQMRSQEEEMRQNMEEMEATQEEMRRAQAIMEIKEANLGALINNTSDSIILIDKDYKITVMNDVIKRRYKGTQYEGMQEGSNALDMLGNVSDEWKGYYDRAFNGEHLSFTIKSSVKGEDTYRHYDINPIKGKNGEVKGASIFSRDVTMQKRAEIEQENLLNEMQYKYELYSRLNTIIELDKNLNISLANKKVQMLTGYEYSELIGAPISMLFEEKELVTLENLKSEEGSIKDSEFTLVSKLGDTRKVKFKSITVYKNGQVDSLMMALV